MCMVSLVLHPIISTVSFISVYSSGRSTINIDCSFALILDVNAKYRMVTMVPEIPKDHSQYFELLFIAFIRW